MVARHQTMSYYYCQQHMWTTAKLHYSQLWTTLIHVKTSATPLHSSELWSVDSCCWHLSDERFQTKAVWWTGDGISSQDDEKDGRGMSDESQMKMTIFLYFVTSGSSVDQIFMLITPNESLASEFKFRRSQKEKRFVEVIRGLTISYEGLIIWVVLINWCDQLL